MVKAKFYIFLFLLFLFLFFSTPKILLFYDAPEYTGIVSSNPFLTSLSLGHTPIHPVFIGALWTVGRMVRFFFRVPWEYGANITALVFGIISIGVFYKISRLVFKDNRAVLTTVVFSLFPAVYTLNTNLMVESFSLTFYLLSVLYFLKYYGQKSKKDLALYSLFVALLVGTHLETIFWLPVTFSIPLVLQELFAKKKISRMPALLGYTLIAISLGVAFYILIFYFSQKDVLLEINRSFLSRFGEHFDLTKIGILRMGRNTVLSLFRGFGILTGLALLAAAIKSGKNKLSLFGLTLFFFSFAVAGSVWTGDFMLRRVAFIGAFTSLFLVYIFPRLSKLLVIYLIPITVSNLLLYNTFSSDKMPFSLMRKGEQSLPKGNVLIQTHYLRPFMSEYNGKILFIGQDGFGSIDKYLRDDKSVFLESQAVFAPYMLYVGNNLHITSLGKFGKSESEDLFVNYTVDLAGVQNAGKRIYFYELKNTDLTYEERIRLNKESVSDEAKVIIGKAKKGAPVFVYSRKISGRLRRERVDYGDMALWMWAFLTGRKEPMVWTYADKQGVFIMPVSSKEVKDIYVTGEQVKALQIL